MQTKDLARRSPVKIELAAISGKAVKGGGREVPIRHRARPALEPARDDREGNSGGATTVAITISSGNLLYIRSAGLPAGHSSGKEWVRVDLAQAGEVSNGVDLGSLVDSNPTPNERARLPARLDR